MKNVTEILDADFVTCIKDLKKTIEDIEKLKEHKNEVEKYIIDHFAPSNLGTDYEGTENLLNADHSMGIKLTYKLNRNVNREKLLQVCAEKNLTPSQLFKVQYEYSATKFNCMNDDCKDAVRQALTSKPAKTSVEIIEKEIK